MVFQQVTGIEVIAATLLLALAYVLGGHRRATAMRHRRAWLSVGAGVSVAYVFIELLPELREAHEKFLGAVAHQNLPIPEHRVSLAALLGFITFYGLEHLVDWSRRSGSKRMTGDHSRPVFWLHIGGFAVYSGLVSYLLMRWETRGLVALALYCTAMVVHFLGADHALRREHGSAYDQVGRWVLAGAVIAGSAIGAFFEIPIGTLSTLQGLIAGGVVINSTIMELPRQNDGRFGAFCLGAIGYSALLILAKQ
jgi:hypothetical protein